MKLVRMVCATASFAHVSLLSFEMKPKIIETSTLSVIKLKMKDVNELSPE